MDINAYIESGAIESYVLGMADAQEMAELEQLSIQHPELRKAIEAFESNLEQASLMAAVPPPAHIKKQLFAQLADSFVKERGEMIKMSAPFSWSRYLAAASIILLVVSAGLNVYFYQQFRSSTNAYQALLFEKTSLLAENQNIQTKTLDLYQSMQLMSDPAMTKVSMPGLPGKETNLATLFWDDKSKDVYLLLNKMPQPSSDKQYQLWAIVDGKPVDAGVIADCSGLCKMKNIPKASMFAITLERKGGSPSPSMDQMYVLGKVG